MAAITIDKAAFVPADGTTSAEIETIARKGAVGVAGTAAYIDSNGDAALVDCNAASDPLGDKARFKGFYASTVEVAGQRVNLVTGGTITTDAVWTKGMVYAVSQTAGKLIAINELTTGDWVCIVGVALSTTKFLIIPPVFANIQI